MAGWFTWVQNKKHPLRACKKGAKAQKNAHPMRMCDYLLSKLCQRTEHEARYTTSVAFEFFITYSPPFVKFIVCIITRTRAFVNSFWKIFEK